MEDRLRCSEQQPGTSIGSSGGDGAGKPRLIFWELTTGCNLRCIHCRASASELASPADLPTGKATSLIDEIAEFASPILIMSGGEPLYRPDVFELTAHAARRGLRVALATNGTLVTPDVARRVADSGVRRVAISLDGADDATHDAFRGVPGAFDAALRGFRNLRALGMSMQINMTIARHNVHQLPDVLNLALELGADALHTFLLVPVGCGVNIAAEQMVPPQEYEEILNWLYDRSREGAIELKATCSPHYFRVVRQRRTAERRAGNPSGEPAQRPAAAGPPFGGAHHAGHPAGLHAMTKGCLAGTGVCFISHQGEVYPCGYLPVSAGDLKRQPFAQIWERSPVFLALRDTSKLKGKCGYCEFRHVCMGCRARAFAATGNFLDEEPFCAYEPRQRTEASPGFPGRSKQQLSDGFSSKG